MAKSDTVIVTAEAPPPPKPKTSLRIDVSPKSGVVPFGIRVSGSLIEATYPYYPLPYMSINVYMDDERIGMPSTMDDGTWYLDYTISEVGTHEIWAEFEGTAEYEGCEEEAEMSHAWGCEDEW